MHTIVTAEVKTHAFIRLVFHFIELVYYWITQPVTTFKVVVLKSEWLPVKHLPKLYMKINTDGTVFFRHKNQPGQYVGRVDDDPIVTLTRVSAYFGL